MTHQLTVLLVNNMNKYYPKDYIGMTILEAIKFCVTCTFNCKCGLDGEGVTGE